MNSGPQPYQLDVPVIGTGAARLIAASSVPEYLSEAILTKNPSGDSTRWAEGSVAAVIDYLDSFKSHVQDTLIAGAGLSHQDVVISRNGAEIRRLMRNYAGIVRTDKRLQRALNSSQLLAREIQHF